MLKYCFIVNSVQVFFFLLLPFHVDKVFFDMYFMLSSGSFFLFNWNVLRHFRNDGHKLEKEKNGNFLRENHEKSRVIMKFTFGIELVVTS
jgi:hypothetical protein